MKARIAKDPQAYYYGVLRRNAKRRGKSFTLTLDEYRAFCQVTNYHLGRGRTKECLHIDRIDPTKGYTVDNIQPMLCSDNSRKADKVLVYDWQTKYATVITQRVEAMEDLPF